MHIRRATVDDAEAISRLVVPLAEKFITADFEPEGEETLLVSLTPDGIRERIAAGFVYHVAEEHGEPVGVVGTRKQRHLYHLFVAETHQRRGIARRLWDVAREACLASGGEGPFLVNASRFAVPVYHRFGFVESGPPQNIHGVISVPMQRPEDSTPSPARPDQVWQDRTLAEKFVTGIRGGVPLAAEQLDVMLRVIDAAGLQPARLLDLGCGDGILGRTLLDRFPAAECLFADFSPAMLDAARERSRGHAARAQFVASDFATPDWIATVSGHAPFGLIVSGFAIHHQPDERKRTLYREVYELLAPGGMFLNLEHVASPADWLERAFEQRMIDSLWTWHRERNPARTRESVASEYVNRPDWSANILAPVEDQCGWLRDIGFVDVDCHFKLLELALFGGLKPAG